MLAATCGGAPDAAFGAAAWLAPLSLSVPGQDAETPDVAVDAAGNAVAVWDRSNGTNAIVQASVRPAGGAWGAPQDLSALGQNAAGAVVAVDPAGNAVAVWNRSNGTNSIVQASVRPAGGAWGAPQDLSVSGQSAFVSAVGIDATGTAITVWRRSNGTNFIIQASVRPAGGAWGAPQDLSAPGQNALAPDVAVDPAGNAIAVWQRSNGTNIAVQASVRPAGGTWGAPQDLSAPGQNATSQVVALGPAGTAVAVWSRSNGTNTIVQASVRPAGGAWGAPQNLSVPGQNAGPSDVAVDAVGNAIATWRRSNGTHVIGQVAVLPVGGAWGAPQDLTAAGQVASLPRVAFDPAGNAITVWERFNGVNNVIQAAMRPAGGAWGVTQDLTLPGLNAFSPEVAFDPAGNAVAVFERSNGANAIVQAAGYDAAGPKLRSLKIPAKGVATKKVRFSVAPFDVWSALAGPTTWRFGDGKRANRRTVRHAYRRGGRFTVRVSQADALGNVTVVTRTIRIVVKCVVPRVVGKTLPRARSALRKAHCRTGKVKFVRSLARSGRVVAQGRRAGRVLSRGARVGLTVSV